MPVVVLILIIVAIILAVLLLGALLVTLIWVGANVFLFLDRSFQLLSWIPPWAAWSAIGLLIGAAVGGFREAPRYGRPMVGSLILAVPVVVVLGLTIVNHQPLPGAPASSTASLQAPPLEPNMVRELVRDYYNSKGHFAGKFEILAVDDVRIDHDAKAVKATYRYRGGRGRQGRDSRVFYLAFRNGSWAVTKMSRHWFDWLTVAVSPALKPSERHGKATVDSAPVTGMVAVWVTARALNVRDRPTTRSRILGTAAYGQALQASREEGGWYRIAWDDSASGYGWVAARHTSRDRPVAASGDPPTVTSTRIQELVRDYYNTEGEFAGTYEMVDVVSVDVTSRRNTTVSVRVRYAYGRNGRVQGRDVRRFDLEYGSGLWRVARMYH